MTNNKLIEIPEEISISVLQQGAGMKYDLFIRMLIHQKSSYEDIKDELLNYDFHSTATSASSTSKMELSNCPVTTVQQTKFPKKNSNKSNYKSSNRPWKSQNGKSKYNSSLSTKRPQNNNSSQQNRCYFCGIPGHKSRECRKRLAATKANASSQGNGIYCSRCNRMGHKSQDCRSNTKITITEISEEEHKNSNDSVSQSQSTTVPGNSSIYRMLMFQECSADIVPTITTHSLIMINTTRVKSSLLTLVPIGMYSIRIAISTILIRSWNQEYSSLRIIYRPM